MISSRLVFAARRSAPAHPPIKSRSPSRKCQSAHTPQPTSASGLRSGRAAADPIARAGAADRIRWPRRRPRVREETTTKRVTRPPFRADSKSGRARPKSGRARPMPKSNRVRAHPKAALRPAVASGCWRRAPPPPISKSQTENSGGPRCRPASATRNGRAPFGVRTPTDQEPITQPEMPERTHATANLGQRISIGSCRGRPDRPLDQTDPLSLAAQKQWSRQPAFDHRTKMERLATILLPKPAATHDRQRHMMDSRAKIFKENNTAQDRPSPTETAATEFRVRCSRRP